MFFAPETRIWTGRVGGDPALFRNGFYRHDVGLSAIVRRVWFRCFPYIPTSVPEMAWAVGQSGSDGYVYSALTSNLSTWQGRIVPGARFRDVVWVPSKNRLVAVGEDGVWVSDDMALTWTQTNGNDLRCVARDTFSGRLVAGGFDRATFYSNDGGDTWQSTGTPPGGGIIWSIAYSPALTRFVAVSDNLADTIWFSNTGLSWTSAAVASANQMRSVVWDQFLPAYVAVGQNGQTWRSPTGLAGTWVAGPVFPVSSVGHVARGMSVNTSTGRIALCSTDLFGYGDPPLAAWVAATGPLGVSPQDTAWSATAGFIAVGQDALKWQSATGAAPWNLVGGSTTGVTLYGLMVVPAFTAIRQRRQPMVNVVHESAGRPAASARFPVGMFSAGISQNVGPLLAVAEGPAVMDMPLVLDWEIKPGDVLTMEVDANEPVPVEFVAELLQAPGSDG